MSTICVLGLGKVGFPLACHLVSLGHRVSGVDPKEAITRRILKGKKPFPWEPIPEELIAKVSLVTTDPSEAIPGCDVAVIIVPTPQRGDTLSSILVRQAMSDVRRNNRDALIMICSTLDPMDAESICAERRVVYTPVLIGLGRVMKDLASAPFWMVGVVENKLAHDLVEQVENVWTDHPFRLQVAPILKPLFVSDPVTVACAKLAINATLSLRVAWANDVARRVRAAGADPAAVLSALGMDPRIGPTCHKEGSPPGGPCLPRDLEVWLRNPGLGLAEQARAAHVAARLRTLERVRDFVGHIGLANPRVLVLGATYNPHALDFTESIGLAVARYGKQQGWLIGVLDPIMDSFEPELHGEVPDVPINGVSALARSVEDADAIILCTPWPEFTGLKAKAPMLDLTWRK